MTRRNSIAAQINVVPIGLDPRKPAVDGSRRRQR
jgi:hypothetical protein